MWTPSGDGILGMSMYREFAVLALPYDATGAIQISAGIVPLEAIPLNSRASSAGVIGAYDGIDVLTCALHNQDLDQQLEAEDTRFLSLATVPWTFATDLQYTLGLGYDLQNTVDCHVERDSASTTTSITLASAVPPSARRLGAFLNGMSARLEWVMLVGR
jgi:hypothetical protein